MRTKGRGGGGGDFFLITAQSSSSPRLLRLARRTSHLFFIPVPRAEVGARIPGLPLCLCQGDGGRYFSVEPSRGNRLYKRPPLSLKRQPDRPPPFAHPGEWPARPVSSPAPNKQTKSGRQVCQIAAAASPAHPRRSKAPPSPS